LAAAISMICSLVNFRCLLSTMSIYIPFSIDAE
jgi:hypothetical protein